MILYCMRTRRMASHLVAPLQPRYLSKPKQWVVLSSMTCFGKPNLAFKRVVATRDADAPLQIRYTDPTILFGGRESSLVGRRGAIQVFPSQVFLASHCAGRVLSYSSSRGK